MSELILPLVPQDLFTESSSQKLPLGTKGETKDGRCFRYCKAGGSDLVAGHVLQTEAEVGNHQNLAVTAAVAVGVSAVTVTLGGTAATANEYSGGYLTVNDADGQGFTYKILSHPAQTSTSGNLVVTLEDPIREALTTSSQATLSNHPYKNVIDFPTTASGAAVGVATFDMTTLYYGWIQTGGAVAILNESGTAVGLGVAPSGASVAGACITQAATTQCIGTSIETLVDTEYSLVHLTID